MKALWRTASAWLDRNFTVKGLIGLLLFLYSFVPDSVARSDYWRARWHAISIFLLSPVGRVTLIVAGVLIIWLDHRGRAKASNRNEHHGKASDIPIQSSKLTIHSANYAAIDGGGKSYDVTEFMRRIVSGNSLVFDIENHNFVIGNTNFVPNDPFFGTLKRLQVSYSYDGGPVATIERRENSRIVLPEDSIIFGLRQQLKQAAKSATEAKDGYLAIIAEMQNKHRDEITALRKDWPREWKEQSQQFVQLSHTGIRADWHDTSAGAGWRICGGDIDRTRQMEVLCRLAGNLLITSPKISPTLPPHIKTEPQPSWRWLYYIKEHGTGYESELLGAHEIFDDGQERRVQAGSIRNLGGVSANLCLDLAGFEVLGSN